MVDVVQWKGLLVYLQNVSYVVKVIKLKYLSFFLLCVNRNDNGSGLRRVWLYPNLTRHLLIVPPYPPYGPLRAPPNHAPSRPNLMALTLIQFINIYIYISISTLHIKNNKSQPNHVH